MLVTHMQHLDNKVLYILNMSIWVSTLDGNLYEVLSITKKAYTILMQTGLHCWVAQEIGYGNVSEIYSHSNISVFSTR